MSDYGHSSVHDIRPEPYVSVTFMDPKFPGGPIRWNSYDFHRGDEKIIEEWIANLQRALEILKDQ